MGINSGLKREPDKIEKLFIGIFQEMLKSVDGSAVDTLACIILLFPLSDKETYRKSSMSSGVYYDSG